MLSFSQLRYINRALRFSTSQQQAFLEDLAMLLEDGVSTNQALEMLAKISKGVIFEITEQALLAISQGGLLADGLQDWYASHIVEMIRAGEEGGSLVSALQAAAIAIANKNTVLTSLLNAMTYPIVVLCLGLGVVVFLNHSIFTDFQTILAIKFWPAHARYLVMFATWLEHWWWFLLVLSLSLCLGLVYLLRNYVGSLRYSVDRLPLLSLYREFVAARLLESLGLLIANGLVLKKALEVLKNHANPYLLTHISTMEYRLGSGFDSIGEVLDTGLIHPADILRLQTIVKGKRFESALLRLGEQANQRSQRKVILSGRISGTVCLVFSAGLALFMIFSIYDVGAVLGKGL